MTLPASAARPAVFLDRDGTINVDRGYVGFREEVRWIEGAVEGMRRIHEAGLPLVVVTNQGAIAKGFYAPEDVERLHTWMAARLAEAGAPVAAWYFAPYHDGGHVAPFNVRHPDRKPGTGMFERAIREHGLDPARSFMVGDKQSDMAPGNTLGMTTLLVRTGYGRRWEPETTADHVVDDLAAATETILALHAERHR